MKSIIGSRSSGYSGARTGEGTRTLDIQLGGSTRPPIQGAGSGFFIPSVRILPTLYSADDWRLADVQDTLQDTPTVAGLSVQAYRRQASSRETLARPLIELQADATDLHLARRDGGLYRLAEAAVEQLAHSPPLAGLGSLDQLTDDLPQVVRGDGLNECPAPGVHPGGVRVSTTGSGVVPGKESAMAVALGLAVPAICERFVHATC